MPCHAQYIYKLQMNFIADIKILNGHCWDWIWSKDCIFFLFNDWILHFFFSLNCHWQKHPTKTFLHMSKISKSTFPLCVGKEVRKEMSWQKFGKYVLWCYRWVFCFWTPFLTNSFEVEIQRNIIILKFKTFPEHQSRIALEIHLKNLLLNTILWQRLSGIFFKCT